MFRKENIAFMYIRLPPASTRVSRSTLKMEAILFSGTLTHFQPATPHYIPEDSTLRNHRCDSLRSYLPSESCKSDEFLCYVMLCGSFTCVKLRECLGMNGNHGYEYKSKILLFLSLKMLIRLRSLYRYICVYHRGGPYTRIWTASVV